MHIESILAQLGNGQDEHTGAISAPIYHSTTYRHPALGESTGFDYTRTKNPTRRILEEGIAALEEGTSGFAFASGMAAITCIVTLFESGDHIVVSNDLYGGTYRLLEQVMSKFGLSATFVDTSDVQAVAKVITPATKAIFVETPTNPLCKVSDIRRIADLAKSGGILLIVDNTFMTPLLQKPLLLGADIVIHSATKYLGGHNDVLAGLVVVQGEELARRVEFLQNSIGGILGPQDCWLLMRGMKTLALRMERHQYNASVVADYLARHPLVEQVYYPGLVNHPGYEVNRRQCAGAGGMLSFSLKKESLVPIVLRRLRLISFAESLGGVESLITFPAKQTHFDIPEEIRNQLGVTNRLLRLSVGIEHAHDIIEDLEQALVGGRSAAHA